MHTDVWVPASCNQQQLLRCLPAAATLPHSYLDILKCESLLFHQLRSQQSREVDGSGKVMISQFLVVFEALSAWSVVAIYVLRATVVIHEPSLCAHFPTETLDQGQVFLSVNCSSSFEGRPVARERSLHGSVHELDGYIRFRWMLAPVSATGNVPCGQGLHLRDYSERILRQLHTHAHTVPFDRGSVERDISIMKHVPYTKSRLVQELRNSDLPSRTSYKALMRSALGQIAATTFDKVQDSLAC